MRFLFENFALDSERRELLRGDIAVRVEPQVFDLLVFLVRNRDRVVSKDDLLAGVWGGRIVSDSALVSRINAARSAIGDDGHGQRLIKTLPRKGVRFVGTVRQIIDKHDLSSPPEVVTAQSTGRPCVEVHAFSSIPENTAKDLAAGLFEEITSALSKFSWLAVRPVDATFSDLRSKRNADHGTHYLLEGGVQRTDKRVRMTARLIDARTNISLWAHRFEDDLDDVFHLQDRLTANVVGAIAAKLEQLSIDQSIDSPLETLDAQGCTLRGMGSLHQWSRVGIAEALRLFHRAIELDPNCALAYGMASYCYVQRQSYGWVVDRHQDALEASTFARRAAELAKDDAVALSKAAHAIASVAQDLDSGTMFVEQALRLNPNLASAWYVSGWLKLFLGKPELAMEELQRALRLRPIHPLAFKIRGAIAYAHFFTGRYDEASTTAEGALRLRPQYLTAMRGAAAGHALAGRSDKARLLLTQMRQVDPKLRLANLGALLPFRPGDLDRWSDALQRAGLPE